MSLFGISFGSSKDKSSSTQNTSGTKTEDQTQSGTSSTSSTQATTSNQNTRSASDTINQSIGQNTTTQNGSTASTGSSATSSAATSKLFSDSVQGGLESIVLDLLHNATNGATKSALNGQVSAVGNFDPEAFVQGIVQAAQAKSATDTGISVAGISDELGGNNNSMTALLRNRINNDATASLAGVESNARAQAANVLNSNVASLTGADSEGNGFLASLLGALKGGTSTQTGATNVNTAENQNTSNTSSTSTSEQSSSSTAGSQDTSSSQIQTLAQVIAQLMSTNTSTVANQTQTTNATGSKSTLGLSGGA